jgi:hypothetical protein
VASASTRIEKRSTVGGSTVYGPFRRVLKTGPFSSSGTFLNSVGAGLVNGTALEAGQRRVGLDRRASGLLCQRLPADHVLLLVVDDLEPLLVQRPLQVMQRDLCRGVRQLQTSPRCGVKVGMISCCRSQRCSEGCVPFHAVKAVAKELSAMLGTGARTPSKAREDEESIHRSAEGRHRRPKTRAQYRAPRIHGDQSMYTKCIVVMGEKSKYCKAELP